MRFLKERIREYAKEKKIPIYKLEREVGLARGSISKWNESEPGIRKVQKVADYLGVPIEKLLE